MPRGGAFSQGQRIIARRAGGGFSAPGSGGTAAAGAALLATMSSWWDATDYTSGALANKGVLGSGFNMTLGPTTQAPTFSAGSFIFDGVDDYMEAPHNAAFVAPPQSTAFTYGVIAKFHATPISSGPIMTKRAAVASPMIGWRLATILQAAQVWTTVYGSDVVQPEASSPATSLNTTAVFSGAVLTNNTVRSYLNGVGGTAVADNRGTPAAETNVVRLGNYASGSSFQKFTLYGAFIYNGALTAQNYSDIGAYYGLTI